MRAHEPWLRIMVASYKILSTAQLLIFEWLTANEALDLSMKYANTMQHNRSPSFRWSRIVDGLHCF